VRGSVTQTAGVMGGPVTGGAPVCQLKMLSTDRSLRLLTTNVRGLRHYAQYTDRLPLLFEVIGV